MLGKLYTALRGLAFLASIAALVAAQSSFSTAGRHWDTGWSYMLAALLAALFWQVGLVLPGELQPQQKEWGPAKRWRMVLGGLLGITGLAWCGYATWALSTSYEANFDFTWMSWFGAAAVMSLGLRFCQVRLAPKAMPMARWEWAALASCFVIACAYHLGNFHNFPPPDAVSQIEELQTGNFGLAYLDGSRNRWEFASWAVVAALSIAVGGPSLVAVRLGFAIINVLKIIPAFFLFRALGGRAAGVFGTLLLAVCGWDSILTRIPSHPDHLVTMIGFSLMTGPAVRGSWAAYPWIAFCSGFTSWSYIVFRPFIGFALAGGALSAWAHPGGSTRLKLLRVSGATLIIAFFTVAMFYPLTHKLHGRFMHEYLDGWNRAHAQTEYYTPDDNWRNALQKRWERTVRVANLFYTVGDENPTHNPDARPTIDPIAGTLLWLGVSYCLARFYKGFYTLSLGAMAVTITGTLIATGNLDCLRGQAAINYVYTVCAIGIGGFVAGAQRSFGKLGRNTALVILSAALVFAAYWNAKLLNDLWNSPVTREHYRNDIAYLSDWLRRNAAGIPVIGLIPSSANVVFVPNDGAWLRGKEVKGEATWDVNATWDKLRDQKDRFLLLIAAPTMNNDIMDYFESVLPGVHFSKREEASVHGVRMGFVTIEPSTAEYKAEAMRRAQCTGIQASFTFRYKGDTPAHSISMLVPFVDQSTWPGEVRLRSHRDYDKIDHIDVLWEGDLIIPDEAAREYTLRLLPYQGTVVATMDQVAIRDSLPMQLTAGRHHFEIRGEFRPAAIEQSMQVIWQKEGEPPHLLPFHRFVTTDEACLAAPPAATEPPQLVE